MITCEDVLKNGLKLTGANGELLSAKVGELLVEAAGVQIYKTTEFIFPEINGAYNSGWCWNCNVRWEHKDIFTMEAEDSKDTFSICDWRCSDYHIVSTGGSDEYAPLMYEYFSYSLIDKVPWGISDTICHIIRFEGTGRIILMYINKDYTICMDFAKIERAFNEKIKTALEDYQKSHEQVD